jgi:hypothetical protein
MCWAQSYTLASSPGVHAHFEHQNQPKRYGDCMGAFLAFVHKQCCTALLVQSYDQVDYGNLVSNLQCNISAVEQKCLVSRTFYLPLLSTYLHFKLGDAKICFRSTLFTSPLFWHDYIHLESSWLSTNKVTLCCWKFTNNHNVGISLPSAPQITETSLGILAVYKFDFILNPKRKNVCALRYILRLLPGYMIVTK